MGVYANRVPSEGVPFKGILLHLGVKLGTPNVDLESMTPPPPPSQLSFCFRPDPLLRGRRGGGGSGGPEPPQALTYPKGPTEKKKISPRAGIPLN